MFTRKSHHLSLFDKFVFRMNNQLNKPKKRWEVRLHQILTQEEIAKVMLANYLAKEEAIKTKKRTPIIEFMVWNSSLWGLRIQESANLECQQVYLAQDPGQYSHIDLRKTKGSKPRDVYIGPLFSCFVREYLEWKKTIGEPTSKGAPFFYSSSKKTFMSTEGLRKAFKRAILRGQIEKKATPHSGRHTMGSHMVPKGFIKIVKDELGHSSLATTDIYTHVLDSHIVEFVLSYEEILYSILKTRKNGLLKPKHFFRRDQ